MRTYIRYSAKPAKTSPMNDISIRFQSFRSSPPPCSRGAKCLMPQSGLNKHPIPIAAKTTRNARKRAILARCRMFIVQPAVYHTLAFAPFPVQHHCRVMLRRFLTNHLRPRHPRADFFSVTELILHGVSRIGGFGGYSSAPNSHPRNLSTFARVSG